jgi:hypothetical protein
MNGESTILVPHGGGFHEDAGLELAVRIARSRGASVTLIGPADEDCIGELEDLAAQTYEDSGVWAKPVPVEGDIISALIDRAGDADLLVMGVTDDWSDNQDSIGSLREAVMQRAGTPLLIVRRHDERRRPLRRWLSRWTRSKDWMRDSAEHPEREEETVSSASSPSGR